MQWPSSLALSPGSGRGSMGIEEQEAFLAVIPAGLSITHAGGGGGVGVEGDPSGDPSALAPVLNEVESNEWLMDGPSMRRRAWSPA